MTEAEEEKILNEAMKEIADVVVKYNIPNVICCMAIDNAWNGILDGNMKIIAHALKDGTDVKYLSSDELKQLFNLLKE